MKSALAIALALFAITSAEAQSHLLVVTGIGGEPRYSDLFLELGKSFVESARTRHGVATPNIVFLSEDPAQAPGLVAGRSTKENVEKEFQRLASVAKPGDYVIIALIGHGSSQGAEGKFNLPGLDLTSVDYERLLQPLAQQRVAFLNLSPGSGDFIKALSAPNRVIITATKTGFERNDAQFPKFFVDALAKDGADTDKDGRVSLLEAFEYGRTEVKRFYEDGGRIMTEHAMLDDDGNKTGNHEPDPRNTASDGSFARTFFLGGRVSSAVSASNPRLAQLLQEKADVEAAIEALRRVKDTMPPAEYEQKLETLILDLAAKNKAIKDAGGGQN